MGGDLDEVALGQAKAGGVGFRDLHPHLRRRFHQLGDPAGLGAGVEVVDRAAGGQLEGMLLVGPLVGKSASQRGGEKSGGGGWLERTKDDLYQEAKKRGIEGRSTMTKQQLKNALGH